MFRLPKSFMIELLVWKRNFKWSIDFLLSWRKGRTSERSPMILGRSFGKSSESWLEEKPSLLTHIRTGDLGGRRELKAIEV